MARTIYHLGLLATLATAVAACGDNGSTSTSGDTGGRGGDAGSAGTAGGGTAGSSMTSVGGGGTGGSMTAGGSGGSMTTGGSGGSGMTTGGTGGMATTGSGGSMMTTGSGGSMMTTGSGGSMMTTGSGGSMMTTGSGGSMMTTGSGGAGGSMGMGGSADIAAVRSAPDGVMINLPVQGAFVTYEKPMLGLDVAGFFVQADQAGPAIFVAVDPATLNPSPQVGDQYDFTATGVTTDNGLKEVTSLTGGMIVSSGNPIDPLVTDVSNAADIVMNLSSYESRAIRITGSTTANFTSAGAPQVAATILTSGGISDPNLRLRMPETVRATYDLKQGCTATVDYGVMWRFNAVAQPSVYSAADLTNMTCPAPVVTGAVPLSPTQVVVSFDRLLDPATVDAADFTFDNGLTAVSATVNPTPNMFKGSDVTVTTSMDMPGVTYTVTVASLNDVLGAPIGMPNTAMFQAYVAVAQMLINEINSNIAGSHDLIEFLVTAGGSTNGITLLQKGTVVDTLATFPDVNVQTGDIIVVHLTPAGTTGIAPASETTSKTQYPNAMYTASYDGAWDFLGNAVGLTYSNRVLELDAPGGLVLDAIPVVQGMSASPPAAFPTVLQALQAAGLWSPADCSGMLCNYMSNPTAIQISVDYFGVGTSATGSSIQRIPGANTKSKADWKAAGPQTFGLPNQ